VRGFVHRADVLESGPSGLLLRTTERVSTRFTRGEAPPDAPPDGAEIEGRLQIDLVADGVVRVRYAHGEDVPANPTPMLIGDTRPRAAGALDGLVSVGLRPVTLHVGDDVCAIGGREKNQWNLWDTFNTGICRTVPDGRPLAVECFALRPGEAVYGFGEKFIGLDKVGQTIDVNMVEATGTTTPRSYKNVPFFVTTAGYGVFFNTSARLTFWVGSRGAADIQVAIEDDFLDYFVILGRIEEVLSRYTDLTGKGAVPPRWSFGYWQSKISYRSAEEATTVVRRLREADVPVDVIHLDTHWFREDWRCDLEFDPERFPDPGRFMADLDRQGVKVSLWQLPYIPEGSKLFDDLADVDGFVRTVDGAMYDIGISYTPGFRGRVGCIDYTNPEAKRVHQQYLRRLLALGARVIKVDFGEQAPLDGVYHDGTPGHRAHNLYPLLYNQAVAEVTAEATGENVIWARSCWAGSQRYPLHWGGDSSANWANLAPQIAGGLSFGLSGFQFWSQDIGGFLGQPDGPLLVRWMQAGLFLSHARIHGMGRRELYDFDDETLRVCRDYLHLRYRLLPYLWATASDCVRRSVPMARPLVVEFQDDPNTWRIADQWLLGDSLLVAPVLDDADERRVYFPAARWTDWWTGEAVHGPAWQTVDAPLDRLPLYLREGALVPMGPVMRHVDEFPVEDIRVRVTPFSGDGERSLVVPVNGREVNVRYASAAGAHTLDVGPTDVAIEVEVVGPDPPSVGVIRS
jgi:alpha-D-xyloside xylohydrolase